MKNIKVVKSVIPVYSIAAVWLIYSAVFPLYRLTDLLIATALSAAVFLLLNKLIPAKETEEIVFVKTGNEDADALAASGLESIRAMRAIIKRIDDPQITGDAEIITETGEKILEFVSKNPESARQAGAFADYYFPAAVKLLDSYAEMKGQPAQGGGNISDTLEHIASALGLIKNAFLKQLDELYEHRATDIKTDIAVLQKILASEGLADTDSADGLSL